MFRKKAKFKSLSPLWDKIKNNELDSAILDIKKQIEEEGERYELYRVMGFAYCRGGDYEDALPFFEEAYTLRPGDVAAKLALVNTLMELKRYSDVVAFMERCGVSFHSRLANVYRKAASMSSDHTDIFLYQLMRKRSRVPSFMWLFIIKQMRSFFEKTLEPTSFQSSFIRYSRKIFINNPIATFVDEFRKVHGISFDDSLNTTALGWELIKQGKFEEASAFAQDKLQADGEKYEFLRLWGFACIHNCQYEEARKVFHKALEEKPDSEKAQSAYADACFKCSDTVTAIKYYEKLVKRRPENSRYRKRLQHALEKENKELELILLTSEEGLSFLPRKYRPLMINFLKSLAFDAAEGKGRAFILLKWAFSCPLTKQYALRLGRFFELVLQAKAKELQATNCYAESFKFVDAISKLSFSGLSSLGVEARTQAELILDAERVSGEGPYPATIGKAKATEFLISAWAGAKFDYQVGMALARLLIKRGLPELGLAVLHKSRIPEPMPLGVAIQIGRCYLAMHKVEEAYGAVENHLDSAKNSLAMVLFLFDAMLAKGQPYAALKLLEQASELGNIAIDRKRVQAALTYECGYPDKALQILDEILEQRPDYAPGKKLFDIIGRHGGQNSEEVGSVLLFDKKTLVPEETSSNWLMFIEESNKNKFMPPEVISSFAGMLHSEEFIPETEIPIATIVRSEDLAAFKGQTVWDTVPLLMNKLQTMKI